MSDAYGDGATGTPPPQLAELTAIIRSNTYRYKDEDQFHEALAAALTKAGVEFAAEVRLSETSRIDFLAGDIGIEVKIAGTPAQVARQLRRYAAFPQIAALLLVTTRAGHRRMPPEIGGKPIRVAWLSGVTL